MQGGIFYFGRNASMMALVGQQLAAAGMEAEGFMDEEKLTDRLNSGMAKLLVIGGGVEDEGGGGVDEASLGDGDASLEEGSGADDEAPVPCACRFSPWWR